MRSEMPKVYHMRRVLPLLAVLSLLSACLALPDAEDTPSGALPATRWDHRPEAASWTEATLAALKGYGADLVTMVPEDIDFYCPSYATADTEDREAFWVGLFSALAYHESTWNPKAVGGGGLWYGLVQIDPRSARWFGCEAKSGSALKDGAANLRCGVRIAAKQVPARGTVSRGMRDWGPFHNASKRAEMASFTREQTYCTPQAKAKNPILTNLFKR